MDTKTNGTRAAEEKRKQNVVFRAFRERDYDALCAFFTALNETDRTHINWNWARFEWMYGHPEFDKENLGAIGLWLDGDRIVGAAVYDMYFGEAFAGALPGYGGLYPAILDYAYGELRDENGLGLAIRDGGETELAAATAAGFEKAEQTENVMARSLDDIPAPTLPEGLGFACLDPEADEEALAWLFWQGFDHGDDRAAFEREPRPRRAARKHMNKDLGVAAVMPGGEPVACCCVWFLPGTDYAYVEPVCTVPQWRKKGVAKAVVFEALGRAKALGAKTAYVISDQAFYRKLGFADFEKYTFYWKK